MHNSLDRQTHRRLLFAVSVCDYAEKNWQIRQVSQHHHRSEPGAVVSLEPWRIICRTLLAQCRRFYPVCDGQWCQPCARSFHFVVMYWFSDRSFLYRDWRRLHLRLLYSQYWLLDLSDCKLPSIPLCSLSPALHLPPLSAYFLHPLYLYPHSLPLPPLSPITLSLSISAHGMSI